MNPVSDAVIAESGLLTLYQMTLSRKGGTSAMEEGRFYNSNMNTWREKSSLNRKTGLVIYP
jgi:hypothetical protein